MKTPETLEEWQEQTADNTNITNDDWKLLKELFKQNSLEKYKQGVKDARDIAIKIEEETSMSLSGFGAASKIKLGIHDLLNKSIEEI